MLLSFIRKMAHELAMISPVLRQGEEEVRRADIPV